MRLSTFGKAQGRRQKKILTKAARGPEIFEEGQRSITGMPFIFLYPPKKGKQIFPRGGQLHLASRWHRPWKT